MSTNSLSNLKTGSFFSTSVGYTVRIVVAAFLALFFAWYGDTNSASFIFLSRSYYIVAAIGFITAYIVIAYVRFISNWLDSKQPWASATDKFNSIRILQQFLLGMLLPGIFIFSVSAVYFSLKGINIFDTLYYRLDHVFMIGPLAVLNAYPLIVFMRNEKKRLEALMPVISNN